MRTRSAPRAFQCLSNFSNLSVQEAVMRSASLFLKTCAKKHQQKKTQQKNSIYIHRIEDFWWIIEWVDCTIDAGRGGSGGTGHLARKAGALHCLRPLLDFVLVAAAVQRHHLTGPRPDMVRSCGGKRKKEGGGITLNLHSTGLWLDLKQTALFGLHDIIFVTKHRKGNR